jgi:hypothetical protein
MAGYSFGMKTNTKSSITLPAEELKLVTSLQAKLKAKSKVADSVYYARRPIEKPSERHFAPPRWPPAIRWPPNSRTSTGSPGKASMTRED